MGPSKQPKQIQWNPDFTNLQGKGKLVRKIGEFEKSGVKLQCLTKEGKRLGSSYREVRKTEGLRNRDSTVTLLKGLNGGPTRRLSVKIFDLCWLSVNLI